MAEMGEGFIDELVDEGGDVKMIDGDEGDDGEEDGFEG